MKVILTGMPLIQFEQRVACVDCNEELNKHFDKAENLWYYTCPKCQGEFKSNDEYPCKVFIPISKLQIELEQVSKIVAPGINTKLFNFKFVRK